MRRTNLRSGLLLLAVCALLAACGEPLRIQATDAVINRNFELHAFSMAPPSYNSAILTPFAEPVPVTAAGAFDVALDLDSDGRIRVMPVRTVVTPLLGVNRVGLMHAGGSFDGILSAPVGEYIRDSVLTVIPGEVVVIEADRSNDLCAFSISPIIYSKLAVLSVNEATGSMAVRFTVDPNCGFRSFEEGIPQN
ncbi:MAG TPA: hypothetical protein VMM17_09595 [Gemmatimonadaceae bacterium]|nr:hypothetical protein [Gemmatimonadaceae bacterium]